MSFMLSAKTHTHTHKGKPNLLAGLLGWLRWLPAGCAGWLLASCLAGWLAAWLAGWLLAGCWLAGWLAGCWLDRPPVIRYTVWTLSVCIPSV